MFVALFNSHSIVHDSVASSDAPLLILVLVSDLFWWYRTCIGKAINARYQPILQLIIYQGGGVHSSLNGVEQKLIYAMNS